MKLYCPLRIHLATGTYQRPSLWNEWSGEVEWHDPERSEETRLDRQERLIDEHQKRLDEMFTARMGGQPPLSGMDAALLDDPDLTYEERARRRMKKELRDAERERLENEQ